MGTGCIPECDCTEASWVGRDWDVVRVRATDGSFSEAELACESATWAYKDGEYACKPASAPHLWLWSEAPFSTIKRLRLRVIRMESASEL